MNLFKSVKLPPQPKLIDFADQYDGGEWWHDYTYSDAARESFRQATEAWKAVCLAILDKQEKP